MKNYKKIMLAAILISACLIVYSMSIAPVAAVTPANGIVVEKVLVAADINWANGNPTFIYNLSTLEGISSGNAQFCTIIEFTKDYVMNNTNEDGTVVMDAIIENVIPDIYVLTEKDTLRYETTSVTAVNGEVSESYWKQLADGSFIEIEKVEVEFNLQKNPFGSATFNGVKTNWADASHADNVMNVFTYTSTQTLH